MLKENIHIELLYWGLRKGLYFFLKFTIAKKKDLSKIKPHIIVIYN